MNNFKQNGVSGPKVLGVSKVPVNTYLQARQQASVQTQQPKIETQQRQNSMDIEKDVQGLPQAKSQMMASYEKSEILTRPPNVYR